MDDQVVLRISCVKGQIGGNRQRLGERSRLGTPLDALLAISQMSYAPVLSVLNIASFTQANDKIK